MFALCDTGRNVLKGIERSDSIILDPHKGLFVPLGTGEDFRPDSDIDVLVEFEPEAQVGFIALSRIQREFSELLQRPVDLVPKEGLKPKIREDILSSAEALYAA